MGEVSEDVFQHACELVIQMSGRVNGEENMGFVSEKPYELEVKNHKFKV